MSPRNLVRLAAELSRDRRPQGEPRCWTEPAVIAAVVVGGAADGYAAVTVTWRGQPYRAAYLSTYAPAAGHNVLVLVQPPAGLIVLDRVIGTP